MKIVDPGTIARLKAEALSSAAKTARVCLHESHDEPIQEMVIAAVRGFEGPAFRHRGLRKTFYILDGTLLITVYADDGAIESRIVLDAAGDAPKIVSLMGDRWHGCAALSEVAVYAETIPGPFFPGRGERMRWQDKG